jgi:hypothetical protein
MVYGNLTDISSVTCMFRWRKLRVIMAKEQRGRRHHTPCTYCVCAIWKPQLSPCSWVCANTMLFLLLWLWNPLKSSIVILPAWFFLFLIFYCCAGGTLWHLQKFLQYIKYIIVEFTLSIVILCPLFPFPGIVSTVFTFPFTYGVHSICTIFTLLPPLPTVSSFHWFPSPLCGIHHGPHQPVTRADFSPFILS